ncbi:MAG: hypothetical protein ACI82F_003286, partial [Planctomycetota bacterium]
MGTKKLIYPTTSPIARPEQSVEKQQLLGWSPQIAWQGVG